jgi:sigma-B regulation protein RsbU (phosphoserine phosphatase)
MSQTREVDEQQKELQRSLEKAGQLQQQMLPDNPKVPGFDFYVLYRPLATVSGDFYDFVKVSAGEIGIVVGDVSGHGMEAALVMSMVKKSLKIHGKGASSAAEVLRVTNADVHEDLAQSTFASVFYGVLDVEGRTLKFSRAGHSPLILFNEARDPSLYTLEPKGLAIGIDKGPVFNRTLEEMELKLAPGDMLVQFTDGVVEAANKKKDEFGMERLSDAVRKYGRHEAQYLAHMIEMTVNEFRGGVPAEDDVTVMCIKVQ